MKFHLLPPFNASSSGVPYFNPAAMSFPVRSPRPMIPPGFRYGKIRCRIIPGAILPDPHRDQSSCHRLSPPFAAISFIMYYVRQFRPFTLPQVHYTMYLPITKAFLRKIFPAWEKQEILIFFLFLPFPQKNAFPNAGKSAIIKICIHTSGKR